MPCLCSFFNRKYPIQLIVKSGCSGMQSPRTDDDTSDTWPSTMATTPNETIKPLEFANTVMMADVSLKSVALPMLLN